MKRKCKTLLFITLLILFSFSLYAQDKAKELDEKERKEVIKSISKLLKANYVYKEVADKMASLLDTNLKNGKYQLIIQPEEYANILTKDLQSVSNDKHLRVMFNPEVPKKQQNVVNPNDSSQSFYKPDEMMRRDNYGFKEVKILDGNIGYLDLRSFTDTVFAGKTAVAAMNFLSNTDAIIIDLRNNGGGSPSMIQLIISYFYSSEPVHLNDFYWRPNDKHVETWTFPYVPGKRRPDIDVYVLTSSSTFSAAEEFSYDLKNLKRATLVGETTGGGAHPGGPVSATERFAIWIPSGMAINPITKTNWEGTGVEPDIKTTKEDALNTAIIKALEKLRNQSKGEKIKQYYDWHIASLNYIKNGFAVDSVELSEYAGKYGLQTITLEGGKLFGWSSGARYELNPMAKDLFAIVGMPNCRVKFVRQNNEISSLNVIFDNGYNVEQLKEK
jgi:retinol-binding protein 3